MQNLIGGFLRFYQKAVIVHRRFHGGTTHGQRNYSKSWKTKIKRAI